MYLGTQEGSKMKSAEMELKLFDQKHDVRLREHFNVEAIQLLDYGDH